ncbi:MAG: YegS/Rv2252/BmrU family lipid kinase [Crocinitomicaceae bacterium]|jgi:diacylglycerol kinase (ATP)|nr:YegS/Rv2252/BmrU family lipid kinase [Crocinitomicaceae bacterium]MBT6515013.1 YegS/Rv2252/BmrU family lipid kinase [Crocinitomicaceae bacterium]
MKKIGFVVNGKKGISKNWHQLIELIKDDFEVKIFLTSTKGHALELAANIEADCIIAVGGDGTLNEVVNGIFNKKSRPLIGVFPSGNGNDFATANGIGKNPEQFAKMLRSYVVKNIDLGIVKNDAASRYFINISSAGLGGHVAQTINQINGPLKYPRSILLGFFQMKKALGIVTGNSMEKKTRLMTAAFCNSTTFANGLMIQPDAQVDDGQLHCCIIGDVKLGTYFLNLKNLKRGIKMVHPEVTYHRGAVFSVNIENGKCHIETDGEYFGTCPATFSIASEKVRFIFPERPFN